MNDKKLRKYLQESLQQSVQPKKQEETIKLCVQIIRKQKKLPESRTDFVQYLSDVFRFEKISIVVPQAVTLLFVCLVISAIANTPKDIPIYIPLFVLAIMPTVFKSQYHKMSEIEAVTRASGAQVILAKLILVGAVNLVCMTVLIFLEVYLQSSHKEIRQMVLYCLVPYLVCMVSMLRLIRLRRRENISICVIVIFGSCLGWGISIKFMPWLYEVSAFGIWLLAFLFFTAFFIKEIHFIITMRKEGKMYGIIL
jgi:hypothetical protein